jgi:hypothetical protein
LKRSASRSRGLRIIPSGEEADGFSATVKTGDQPPSSPRRAVSPERRSGPRLPEDAHFRPALALCRRRPGRDVCGSRRSPNRRGEQTVRGTPWAPVILPPAALAPVRGLCLRVHWGNQGMAITVKARAALVEADDAHAPRQLVEPGADRLVVELHRRKVETAREDEIERRRGEDAVGDVNVAALRVPSIGALTRRSRSSSAPEGKRPASPGPLRSEYERGGSGFPLPPRQGSR